MTEKKPTSIRTKMPRGWGDGRPVYDHGETGEQGDVAVFLIAAEDMHHDEGWDNTPAMLYQLSHDKRNRCGHGDGYDVASVELGRLEGFTACEELTALAMTMRSPVGPLIIGNLRNPPTAHILVTEAWFRSDPVEDVPGLENRSLADIPGSEEVRVGCAVTADRLMMVMRKRGCAPLFNSYASHRPEWFGPVLDALRDVHTAACAAYEASPR